MMNFKRNLLYIAFFAFVATAAGCTNVREMINGPVPTSTPSPTPTRSISVWATATPVTHDTPTPTMTIEEALQKAENDVREQYGQTATPTPKYAKPATPTPYVQTKPTPTLKPGVSPTPTPTPITLPNGDPDPYESGTVTATPTPTKGTSSTTPGKTATKTPTPQKTKTPTPTPTRAPKPSGAPTAAYLLNLLYEAYPDLMATTSIMVDLRQTDSDGDVTNMYYTMYSNSESYKNIVHTSTDLWLNSGSSEQYLSNEIYDVINSSNVMTYTQSSAQPNKWNKQKSSAGSVPQGITLIARNGNIALLNPVMITSDPDAGYEIEMDCAVDFTEILSLLTDGSYKRKFNKTFKARALFDYNTLRPVLFVAEAEEMNVSNNLVLYYYQARIDNILDNTFTLEVPDEALK
jgi:hypothetical protein